MANSLPLRWPAAWHDSGLLKSLPTAPVNFQIVPASGPPTGITVVKGPWPGIRLSPAGGNQAIAGPTGEPWVDSNSWRVRVASALHPEQKVWVDSKPDPSRIATEDYLVAIADAGVCGGQWIITLDDHLAAGIAARNAAALAQWKRIVDAASFFDGATDTTFRPAAVIGVVSGFTGSASAYAGEVINNLARTKQQYVAIPTALVTPAKLAGLKALIYPDTVEAPPEARKAIIDFVAGGGMLLTRAVPGGWGRLPKPAEAGEPRKHPRFTFHPAGKGVIAEAGASSDPYRMANDAVVVVSHSHDLARFWNSGAVTPVLSKTADGHRARLQIVFYSARPVEDVAVWIHGSYRTAQLRAFNQTQPQTAKLEVRDGGVEVHLPGIAQYAAIELDS